METGGYHVVIHKYKKIKNDLSNGVSPNPVKI